MSLTTLILKLYCYNERFSLKHLQIQAWLHMSWMPASLHVKDSGITQYMKTIYRFSFIIDYLGEINASKNFYRRRQFEDKYLKFLQVKLVKYESLIKMIVSHIVRNNGGKQYTKPRGSYRK